MKRLIYNNPKQQTGTVLAVSLVILMVLTIIGVSGLSTSSLQEKISGNFRDREVAFQAAEAALAYAEWYANNNINDVNGVFVNSGGFYAQGSGPTHNTALTGTWWDTPDTTCKEVPDEVKPDNVPTHACFTMEYRGEFGEEGKKDPKLGGYGQKKTTKQKVKSFRITVRATGMSDNTWVVLQSYYGKILL